MALINKIRERSGLTIGFVAIALISFLVGGDLLSPNSKLLGNNPTDVGFIDGKEIDYPTMQNEIDFLIAQSKMQTGQNPTQAQISGFQNDAWNRIIFQNGYKPSFSSLGISVSKEERDDMLAGENLHPSLKQSFVDPATNQFNKDQLIQYIRIFDGNNAPEGMNPQDFAFRKSSWESFKSQIPDDRLQNKFINLFTKSTYVTSKEAEKNYKSTSTLANVKYVYIPYYSISDSTVEVTDNMLTAYLNSNSKMFEKEASRSFDYISFPIVPSKEDTLAIKDEMVEIISEFKTTKNDTIFARQYSDNFSLPTKSTIAQLPLVVQSMNLDSGNVSDIINEGNTLSCYKITNISEDTNFSVKASHILIKWDTESDEDKATAKKKASAILDSIRRGSDFSEMAIKHSVDYGSGRNGGDLGWFAEGAMVPTFNDAVFAKEGTGLITNLVESRFGYHIINVTAPKTNVAYTITKIERNVFASEDTKDEVYSKVSLFLEGISSTEEFIAKAESDATIQKYSSGNVGSMDQYLKGLGEARTVVRWAFNSGDDNEVSKVLTLDNSFVVAALTNVNKKGTASLESVREEVAIKVRNAEKAKLIAAKINASESLENIATTYGNDISVKTANAQSLSSNSIDGIGFDPITVGAIFSLQNGSKSSIIEGENGVVIVELVAKTDAAPKEDFKIEKTTLAQGIQSRTNGTVFQALKELTEIEDNRVRYY